MCVCVCVCVCVCACVTPFSFHLFNMPISVYVYKLKLYLPKQKWTINEIASLIFSKPVPASLLSVKHLYVSFLLIIPSSYFKSELD